MKVVLVGEAWGRSEDQFKHPLVGASGREMSLQLGISGLGPFMTKLCRACKRESRFMEARCEFCAEYLWPNEFDLINYWKHLKDIGLIHVTNVFNMRPPSQCNACGSTNVAERGRGYICNQCKSRDVKTNDVGFFFGRERETDLPPCKIPRNTSGTHIKRDFYPHVQRLWRELDDLRPNLVIALGNTPSWALLGRTNIMTLRGTINWCDRLNLKVLPTVHPAGVMRQWTVRPDVIADLRKAKSEAEFAEVRRPKRWITIPAPNADGIEEIRAWFAKGPVHELSNDIETIKRQISIIGFSRDPSEALVIPFRDCETKDGKIINVGKIADSIGFPNGGVNYWPSADLEFAAWKLAIEKIEDRRTSLVFQNGIYDMSYYIKMGIHPYGADEDTMLWHHAMYPEKPKSLGYLGSIYCNDIAWKTFRRATDSLKRDE